MDAALLAKPKPRTPATKRSPRTSTGFRHEKGIGNTAFNRISSEQREKHSELSVAVSADEHGVSAEGIFEGYTGHPFRPGKHQNEIFCYSVV